MLTNCDICGSKVEVETYPRLEHKLLVTWYCTNSKCDQWGLMTFNSGVIIDSWKKIEDKANIPPESDMPREGP